MSDPNPTIADVRAASARLAEFVVRTEVVRSDALDGRVGARILLKCEHHQHTRSFKYRGATNAVQSLSEAEAQNGVATHSSGNHGQALAMAARLRGIPCHVVMPTGSVGVKRDGVSAQGGVVYSCEPTMTARVAGLAAIVAETGAVPIHPFEDPRVIAGQGTAADELLTEHPDIEIIVTPVGGGGLISGTAIAAHGISPSITTVGAEPDGARDAHDSLATGRRVVDHTPDTICDGLRGTVGQINLDLMRSHAVDVVLVSDDEVRAAMTLFRSLFGEEIEPSSATALAALVRYPELFANRTIGLIVTGGNIDPV